MLVVVIVVVEDRWFTDFSSIDETSLDEYEYENVLDQMNHQNVTSNHTLPVRTCQYTHRSLEHLLKRQCSDSQSSYIRMSPW